MRYTRYTEAGRTPTQGRYTYEGHLESKERFAIKK